MQALQCDTHYWLCGSMRVLLEVLSDPTIFCLSDFHGFIRALSSRSKIQMSLLSPPSLPRSPSPSHSSSSSSSSLPHPLQHLHPSKLPPCTSATFHSRRSFLFLFGTALPMLFSSYRCVVLKFLSPAPSSKWQEYPRECRWRGSGCRS
jgi:hypothetical protein